MTSDEATILEIKATIALPFQLSLTTFVVQWRQRFVPYTHSEVYFFAYFLVSLVAVVAQAELASSVTSRKACNSWYAMISPEKPTICWKTRDEPTSVGVGTHTEAQLSKLFLLFPRTFWSEWLPSKL